jgi:hypothetical protein
MTTMSDAEIIAWARDWADQLASARQFTQEERYRRLADLAEKGAALRETVKAWIDADVGEDQVHLDKLVEMVTDPLPAPPGGER